MLGAQMGVGRKLWSVAHTRHGTGSRPRPPLSTPRGLLPSCFPGSVPLQVFAGSHLHTCVTALGTGTFHRETQCPSPSCVRGREMPPPPLTPFKRGCSGLAPAFIPPTRAAQAGPAPAGLDFQLWAGEPPWGGVRAVPVKQALTETSSSHQACQNVPVSVHTSPVILSTHTPLVPASTQSPLWGFAWSSCVRVPETSFPAPDHFSPHLCAGNVASTEGGTQEAKSLCHLFPALTSPVAMLPIPIPVSYQSVPLPRRSLPSARPHGIEACLLV